MRSATVQEAKENLEELIEAAQSGERVEITAGGRRVASIVAAPQGRGQKPAEWEGRMSALEARGLITRPKGGPKPAFPRLPEPVAASGVLDALIEERREGR